MAAELVARLDHQIRRPDHIFILGAKSSDLELVADRHDITVRVVPDALPALRRQGVKLAGASYDYLVFFDDSFLPSRLWITQALSYLERWPDVAGVSGLVLTGEQDIFGRGDQNDPVLVAMLGNAVHGRPLFFPATCIDGVNMAVRRSALEENELSEGVFDDFEISAGLARWGSIGQLTALFGLTRVPVAAPKNGHLLGVMDIDRNLDRDPDTIPHAEAFGWMSNAFVSEAVRAVRPRRSQGLRGQFRDLFFRMTSQ
jgi:cellulose synthase/poly-beta-1,6-N-acetylglucosamine synthase-like glycosyltransferase